MAFNPDEARDFHGRWTGTRDLVHHVLGMLHDQGHISGAEHMAAKAAIDREHARRTLDSQFGKPPHADRLSSRNLAHANHAIDSVARRMRHNSVGAKTSAITKRDLHGARALEKASTALEKHHLNKAEPRASRRVSSSQPRGINLLDPFSRLAAGATA